MPSPPRRPTSTYAPLPKTARLAPPPKPRGPRILKAMLAVLLLAPLTVVGIAASLPLPVDHEGAVNTAGPSGAGGLASAWPDMPQRPDNSISDPRFASRAALGHLLFYDPLLSGKNDISCATCHHPDLGYSDGRGKSMGAGGRGLGPDRTDGQVIRRGAPTIWNAAFNRSQFWDGRAKDLEDQARNPITAPEEMGETDANLSAELATVPEYQALFDEAFGGHMGSSINLLERNRVYDNAGGILVFALPGNPSKEAKRTRVALNQVTANNHENFADPGSIVAQVPSGGGVFILAADETEVTENQINDNNSFGVAVLGLRSLFPGRGPFDVGALPDRTRVHGNTYSGNGKKADKAILAAGLQGADLLWDLSGPSNTWNEPNATAAVPVLDERWPAFLRRAVFQFLIRARKS